MRAKYLGITSGDNTLEKGVGGILELHLHSAERDLHALDAEVEEVELDRLVGTEGLSGAKVGQERIANLASSTSNADSEGSLCHYSCQRKANVNNALDKSINHNY